jgi:GLPGLI family protein
MIKKNSLLLIVLILICNKSFSQEKELFVEYDFYTNSIKEVVELRANWLCSYSKTLEKFSEWEQGLPLLCPSVFKNFKKNEMYWYESDTELNVVQEMSYRQWNILNETKEILNFNCRKAKGVFHGREYIAWFTTDIPFKAAPWRFNGLPGVLLAIKSTDKFVDVEAKKVLIKPANKEIKNPVKEEKCISWNEFVEIYRSEMKKLYSYIKTQLTKANLTSSGSFEMRIDKIKHNYDLEES